MRTALLAPLFLGLAASCTSTSMKPIHLPAENALGPYSASVESHGFVFVSGKGGTAGGSFAEEAEGAVRALEKELARSQLTLADVLSVNVFLIDMAQYAEFNQVYARLFPQPYPARACVAVASLPAKFRVEIQAVAARH